MKNTSTITTKAFRDNAVKVASQAYSDAVAERVNLINQLDKSDSVNGTTEIVDAIRRHTKYTKAINAAKIAAWECAHNCNLGE